MTFTVRKEHANKLLRIENGTPVVLVPAGEFAAGDALIMFNDSDNFITLQSQISRTYRSGFAKAYEFFEVAPHALINAVFVDADTLVITVGV